MTEFNVHVENVQPDILVIETSFIDNIGAVEIERYPVPSVNIFTGTSQLDFSVIDLPNIPVSKIIGLDEYLDEYEFDCGTP